MAQHPGSIIFALVHVADTYQSNSFNFIQAFKRFQSENSRQFLTQIKNQYKKIV